MRTLDAILAGMVDEVTAAEEFCAAGGGIVLAGDDDLAALEAAAQPVIDELMRDDSTAALIERIGELKASAPAPPTPSPPASSRRRATAARADFGGRRPAHRRRSRAARTRGRSPAPTPRRSAIDESFIDAEIGPDDELDVAFEFTDDGRWTQLADYTGTGVLESGDFGTYTYDDEGRLVTTSNGSGLPRLRWRHRVDSRRRSAHDGARPVRGQPRPYDPIEILMTRRRVRAGITTVDRS